MFVAWEQVWASQTTLSVTHGNSSDTSTTTRDADVSLLTTYFVMAVGNKDTPAIGGGYTLQYVDLQGLDSRKPYLVRKWSADTAVGCTEKMQASACATTWLPPLVDGEGGGGSNGVGAPHLNLDRQNQSSYAWSAEHQIMCYSCRFFLLGGRLAPCALQ